MVIVRVLPLPREAETSAGDPADHRLEQLAIGLPLGEELCQRRVQLAASRLARRRIDAESAILGQEELQRQRVCTHKGILIDLIPGEDLRDGVRNVVGQHLLLVVGAVPPKYLVVLLRLCAATVKAVVSDDQDGAAGA